MLDAEFLLFDHLLRYVHQSDQNGDIARSAVSILLELPDKDLANYVTNSDFSTVTVAGLGGHFSQLPCALPSNLLSGKRLKHDRLDDFYEDLDSFLRLLEFIQRVCLVCPHGAIVDSLLKDLRHSFLDNVVLSSIVNGSDFDGSTVSCLFYLEQMIGVVNEYQLSRCFSRFLLNSDTSEEEDIVASGDEISSQEVRLHLRDILVSKLNSLSEEVVSTTLLLFSNLTKFHNGTCLDLLFENLPKTISAIQVDVKYHHQILEVFQKLLMGTLDTSGSHSLVVYLNEADKMRNSYRRGLIKGVCMSRRKQNDTRLSIAPTSSTETGLEQLKQIGKDTVLRKFISKFGTFFSHSFEINVALTGLLSQVASMPHPAVFVYMFYGEALIPGEAGLLSVLQSLSTEIEDFSKQISRDRPGDFENRLNEARKQVYNFKSARKGRRLMADMDLDEEFLWNCVLLEEVWSSNLSSHVGCQRIDCCGALPFSDWP